jgi:replication-associated recombination protein RarA
MDLFEGEARGKDAVDAWEGAGGTAPLAYRMAPRTFDEYVGQRHVLGEGKLLRRAVEADRVSSIILYGPPGRQRPLSPGLTRPQRASTS